MNEENEVISTAKGSEEVEIIDDGITTGRNVIKIVDANVSHRICSGQVIVTLSTAVKELVENSLDAGAKSIEIRLVEYGSKLIEVKDNGVGVDEWNLPGLVLKHHTSKLSQFEDLESIGTFGFRGEALSSLCALSQLSVTTRTKESKQGFKIEYDSKGRILNQTSIARLVGTTVTLADIFSPLPVRHKELLKNLKREFHKIVNVLYSYAFVTSGIRISCTNEVKFNGLSSNVLCVPASETPKERVSSIFGPKQLSSLIDITEGTEEANESILAEFGITKQTYHEGRFKLSGVISKPNSGRSCADRQYFYVNSRPCDSPKISRLVNEVYHTFSRSQYPFIYLNITTEQEKIDVNVTPDKRSIYLQNEKSLYAKIKGTLLENLMKASSNFSPADSIQTTLNFTPTQSSEVLNGSFEDKNIHELGNCVNTSLGISPSTSSNMFDRQFSGNSSNNSPSSSNSRLQIHSYLNKFKLQSSKNSTSNRNVDNILPFKRSGSSFKPTGFSKMKRSKQPKLMDFVKSKEKIFSLTVHGDNTRGNSEDENENEIEIIEPSSCQSSAIMETQITPTPTPVRFFEKKIHKFDPFECDFKENCEIPHLQFSQASTGTTISSIETLSQEMEVEICGEEFNEVEYSHSDDNKTDRRLIEAKSIIVNWESVLKNSSKLKQKWNVEPKLESERNGRKFLAKISPDDNKSAENELKKEFSKEMFIQMKLIGQFNLGFIITKFGSDLFIVDQHAADEKYNYEDLEKTTVLQGQRLIIPMLLQLPAASENILIDNLEVFEKNGFNFTIRLDSEPTKRISMTKIPYSKSCQFGKLDVEELIFLLEDAPEKSFYRPIKVKTMLASRACRKSVMVGDKLNIKDMGRVVGQLGRIEQPWNCPHGRPTLRHLFNLDLLPDADWFKFNS